MAPPTPSRSTTAGSEPAGRRGRLPAQERARREQEVLQAAMAVIVERGYTEATMQAIADAARASKETLYSWFGDRESLLTALIRANADTSAAAVAVALSQPAADATQARATLENYAQALLSLLTGPVSIALNRAAMSSRALAAELLASGRHRVGPVVAAYLQQLHTAGLVPHSDGERAFSLLYGLVVQDTQIRVLLGEEPPTAQVIAARARWAVKEFLATAPAQEVRVEPVGGSGDPASAREPGLAEVRAAIDVLDGQMLRLLAKRQRLVERAGQLKHGRGPDAVRAPDSVEQVIRARRETAEEVGADPGVVEQVWRTMITAFTEFERATTTKPHG